MKKPKNRFFWFIKSLFFLAIAGSFLGTLVAGLVFWTISKDLPSLISVADYRPPIVTRVLGNQGKEDSLLAEFYRERRYLVPTEKIPELVLKAFVAAEDDRFFEHQGLNLASIIRAGIVNFKAGHVVQGGSTITQQVAKSLLLTPERSFDRKLKEVILAIRIEKNLTKQQILYLYLNQIYLGHGAYGVQAASKAYFHKDVSELTLAEAAMLGGLPQAPGKDSPLLNPKRAKERQLYVLRRMAEIRFISQSEFSNAAAQPLRIYLDEDLTARNAAYYIEHVRKYVLEKYGKKALFDDGLIISVAASPELSVSAKKNLQAGLRLADKRSGYRGPLQRLKSMAEVETFLRTEQLQLIDKKLGFRLLHPDGRLDSIEAMKAAGFKSDNSLLDSNDLFKAVVTSLDDKRKFAGVMIGAIHAELPWDQMRWAYTSESGVPSKVLKKGDVIFVRPIKITDTQVIVALDQEPIVQGALFSMEAQTGYVLAMEGGYDFTQSEFNRAIQAQRQPGSSFKPIIYAAAIEKGFTPASVIVDSPVVYDDAEQGKWKPTNFEEKFYGDTIFRQALIKSRNVPTIKMVQEIQVPFLIEFAKRLGMTALFSPDLSIALGSATVSLMELSQVYAIFPRLGHKITPIFITSIKDRDGRILEENKPILFAMPPKIPQVVVAESSPTALQSPVPLPQSRQIVTLPAYPPAEDPSLVLDPRIAFVMTHLMKEVITYGTGREAKSLGRVAAGKTGTTNDYQDAWFMGFTPEVVTGTWVGFDNQKSIGPNETGARAALPIWLDFMKEVIKSQPNSDFIIPSGIVFANINPMTGKLAASQQTGSVREAFIEGTEPQEMGPLNAPTSESESKFLKEDLE